MKRFIAITLISCLIISCSSKKIEKDSKGKKVFLELVLGNSREDAMKKIDTLIKNGKIQKSNTYITFSPKDNYEYSFFLKEEEFKSVFTIYFSSIDDLLKVIVIEIQDPKNNIRADDLRKLLEKKYGSPSDSNVVYYSYNLKNPYKTYNWKKLNGIEISVERKNTSSFMNKNEIGNPYEDNANFIKITYLDTDLSTIDWKEQINKREMDIKEKQKRIEKDI